MMLWKQVKWSWDTAQQLAFEKTEDWDPNKVLVLVCDTSPYRVGVVLWNKMGNSLKKLLPCFVPLILKKENTLIEIKYWPSTLVLNVLINIFWSLFTILSNHKPLQHLFNESGVNPISFFARIQRWALILGPYHYTIQYKFGPKHANPNIMNWLQLSDATINTSVTEEKNIL